jgi:hypothetical protein
LFYGFDLNGCAMLIRAADHDDVVAF